MIARDAKYEIDTSYRNNRYEFIWRLVAVNGRIIATAGESYVHKFDAQHSIDLAKSTTSLSQYEVYQGVDRLWRWRLKANNGKIIAVASESYHNKSDAEWGAGIVIGTNVSTPVMDLTVVGTR